MGPHQSMHKTATIAVYQYKDMSAPGQNPVHCHQWVTEGGTGSVDHTVA